MQLNSFKQLKCLNCVISTLLASLNRNAISFGFACVYLMPCVWAFPCTSVFSISQRRAMFLFTHQLWHSQTGSGNGCEMNRSLSLYQRERERERHRKTEELSLPWHPLLSLLLALIPFSSRLFSSFTQERNTYRNPWGHGKGPLAIIKILHFILHACMQWNFSRI